MGGVWGGLPADQTRVPQGGYLTPDALPHIQRPRLRGSNRCRVSNLLLGLRISGQGGFTFVNMHASCRDFN